jgi:septum site-determining protein MinD
MSAKVISIVSGKGGSGKTLLTAVLGRALAREGKRVLLVDMDIFVRGLTVLLFSYTRPERSGGKVTISDALGVFTEKSEETGPTVYKKENFLIERFFECDVIPSVENVALPLDYNDRSLSDETFTNEVLKKIKMTMIEDYDYIILDNRAGMDSLIASACKSADITIAIAEDDDVGRQTNSNLTKFLQTRKEIKIVYSIINKGRNMHSYKDVKERLKQRHEYSVLGAIPFDIEVLEDFGADRFWSTITETLYFRSLIDVWNELAKTERVQELTESKYRFPPKIFMQPSQGRFSLFERMMRMYSVTIILSGVVLWLWQNYKEKGTDLFDMLPVLLIVAGVMALLVSMSGFQAFLKGRTEDKYRKIR